ncbi:glycerophosphodiester phosphodiesterase GDPD6 [Lactuca sativa]|uniref:glycerophosphodiester phosphodiesterase GDPD6 n=1 Tax=Lactuca sativa TaxID=4236 RepID=UPI0022B05A85|nr:glycerophosphodiester phosphodiesterase GDPD6 [Lactuca sativa]
MPKLVVVPFGPLGGADAAWFSIEDYNAIYVIGYAFFLDFYVYLEKYKRCSNLSQDSTHAILFGCASQYIIMPTFGFIISRLLGLSPSLSVGLILLSCCPGGTASNNNLICTCTDLIITFLLLFIGCSSRPLYPLPSHDEKTKMPLQTFRPFNVAHRGSNGELPEETAPSYLRAIEEGTDFIETDILVSKNDVLMCHHDVILDDTTDVLEHIQFADRKRTYEVEGANMTGLFIFDFTLEELKTLRAKQRFSFRDQQYNGSLPLFFNQNSLKR